MADILASYYFFLGFATRWEYKAVLTFTTRFKARSHQRNVAEALLEREKFFPIWIYRSPPSSKLKIKENLRRRFCVAPFWSTLPGHYFSVVREEASGVLRCCERCPSDDLRMRPAPLRGYKLWHRSFSVVPLRDVVLNESLPHRRFSSISLRIARVWYNFLILMMRMYRKRNGLYSLIHNTLQSQVHSAAVLVHQAQQVSQHP